MPNHENETLPSPDDPKVLELLSRLGASASMATSLMLEKVQSRPEIQGNEDDTFVTGLREIWEHLNLPEDATVLYPGSATHVGVARVIGKEHVVHIDPDERAVEVLKDHDYKAEAVEIANYTPDTPVDAIVALNSYGKPTPELLGRLLKPGGVLIANNHTNWATDAAKAGLMLEGAMLPSYAAEDRQYYEGDQVAADALEPQTKYYFSPPEGGMREVEGPGEYVFAETRPRYPDGLFVFQKPGQ